MSKIILLGDTHLHFKSGSVAVHNRFKLFFEFLFQYMLSNSISTIVQFGDLFDHRKNISFISLGMVNEYFFMKLRSHNFKMHVFIGNHDIPYTNTLKFNSPSLLLGQYLDKEINLIEEPVEMKFGSTSTLIIPWVCESNEKACLDLIRDSTADLCFGHFDIVGYDMYKGTPSQHGLDPKVFKNFKKVYSGHYHTISKKGNIQYIGSPYQLTWGDFGDERGFFVLDTETQKCEFVKNPYVNFHKIIYDDTKEMELPGIEYRDTFVKLIIRNQNDFVKYETYIDSLNSNGAIVEVIEELKIEDEQRQEDIIFDETKDDVRDLLESAASKYQHSNPEAVHKLLNKIYDEVLSS